MEIMEVELINQFYKNKKVLVTGHTGFKGSWLTIWLLKMGANVVGYSLEGFDKDDNFSLTNLSDKIKDVRGDIRERDNFIKVVEQEKPDMLFHLAAQALVIDSYEDPVYTYETNVMGTVNVLEAVRQSSSISSAIFITTDKVYDNKEWIWPYRENEPMGGYDPYSSSKGASELIIASYRNSYFNPKEFHKHGKSIASVRAGNVIGGGDWNKNRILPDCIKAIENEEVIKVRNPKAVRPWQHVLDPLSGYLLLGYKLNNDPIKFSEAWNFGPEGSNIVDVGSLVNELIAQYKKGKWEDISDNNSLHEANFLALDINKAKYQLNWHPVLNFKETMKFTIEWYKKYKEGNVFELCIDQIDQYCGKLDSN